MAAVRRLFRVEINPPSDLYCATIQPNAYLLISPWLKKTFRETKTHEQTSRSAAGDDRAVSDATDELRISRAERAHDRGPRSRWARRGRPGRSTQTATAWSASGPPRPASRSAGPAG